MKRPMIASITADPAAQDRDQGELHTSGTTAIARTLTENP